MTPEQSSLINASRRTRDCWWLLNTQLKHFSTSTPPNSGQHLNFDPLILNNLPFVSRPPSVSVLVGQIRGLDRDVTFDFSNKSLKQTDSVRDWKLNQIWWNTLENQLVHDVTRNILFKFLKSPNSCFEGRTKVSVRRGRESLERATCDEQSSSRENQSIDNCSVNAETFTTKTRTFKKHSVIPAECSTCSLFAYWAAVFFFFWKFELSVEVNGKVWRKADTQALCCDGAQSAPCYYTGDEVNTNSTNQRKNYSSLNYSNVGIPIWFSVSASSSSNINSIPFYLTLFWAIIVHFSVALPAWLNDLFVCLCIWWL